MKLEFLYARAIKEVWIMDSDGRSKLTPKTLSWIRKTYADVLSDIDTGTPLYYSLAIIGLSPEQASLTSEDYTDEFTYDVDEIRFGDHYLYNGIIFMPPSDGVYTVTIIGEFFSKTLSNDTDNNY